MSENTDKLRRLIGPYGNAQFDCGDHNGEWFEYSREIERWVREARASRHARV